MSPRESNPAQLSLRIRGNLAIRDAVDAARKFGSAQRLARAELARLCVVIEELIANLYDHGGVTGQDQVQLILCREPAGIRVTIIAPGMVFDPWSAALAAANGGGGSGAGIKLVRAWAERISYRPASEGNRLDLLVPMKFEG